MASIMYGRVCPTKSIFNSTIFKKIKTEQLKPPALKLNHMKIENIKSYTMGLPTDLTSGLPV
jgi:hypothetical protein